MATPKQVMDFRPSKGITTAQSNEHQRRWTEKGWGSAESTGNYDRSRERLNFEVRGGKVCPIDKSRSIPERMADILRSRGIKDPNEGLAEPRFRTVVNFIFGGSRERMTELAFGDQKVNLTHGADNSHLTRCKDIEEWAKDVYRFVADKYGEENIVAFILHLDETNPHVHCTLLPIKDGKFAYKQIFAGKDKYEFSARMKALHSEFADVNKRWGMERGTSVSDLYYFVLLVIEKNFLLKFLKKCPLAAHIYTLFFVVLGWGIFTANQPGAPLGLLLNKLFVPQGGISPVYYLRNYGVFLVLGCVCSSVLPRLLWERISRNTAVKAVVSALLALLCIAYVVAATNTTALYANF